MYLQTGDCLDLRMARSVLVLGAVISLLTPGVSSAAGEVVPAARLDTILQRRIAAGQGSVRVIIRATDVSEVETQVAAAGGQIGRRLTGAWRESRPESRRRARENGGRDRRPVGH